MTQEQKAKAYDEALERAKKQRADYQKELDKTDRNSQLAGLLRAGISAIDMAFPELTESEDENLKNKSGYYKDGKFWKASTLWNATKNKIPQRVSNRYILQECTWNIGTLQLFADEVKNVQEVSLDYPIILDMNGNILDGAHRVVKAYLEGKDIDIVYLGDNEWPEPDYDEEKAVKESEDERIRKALIDLVSTVGEYYLKSDSRSKMLLYLEKQKEQKPSYCLYGGDPSVGRCRWCSAACSARLTDVHTDEEKEYVRTIKSIISDFIRDKKPENLAYYQRIYDWLDGRHVPFSCGHENDKSAWSEEDENALKYIHELLVFGYTEKFMDAQTTHDMRKWVNEHLRPDTFQNGNSHWKPSEEQMEELNKVRTLNPGLDALYQQLKNM